MRLPARPVLPGFHPDPSVCRVGEDHYLVCSSFEYAPGVPIYSSKDLRSWRQLGHVLDRRSQLSVGNAPSSGGIYAPTLRYHDGRFSLITTNTSDRAGQLLVTAQDPAGPWSDPVWVPDAVGIDPDLAWDDDGACYLTWSALGPTGHAGIVQAVLDPATGALLDEPRPLWQGTGGKFPEGPHLYRIGRYWYLLIAEGGTERGHAVTIARGASPAGPFEPSPANPLLTARGTDSRVQNTGHADLVERSDGSWAMVYLGVRPRGYTPHWHVLGRETFASEVVWNDGWPTVAEPIEPAAATFVEELAGPGLPPSWVASGRFPDDVLHARDDGWRLSAAGSEKVFVGRRQQHFAMRARATVDAPHGRGGLELRIDPRHAVTLEVADGQLSAVVRIGATQATLGELAVGPGAVLELRTEPTEPQSATGVEAGPDHIIAGVVRPDGFLEIGRLDGRYLSTEVAGGFTGRMVGVVCSRGHLDIRSFSYTGADEPALLEAPATPADPGPATEV